MQEVNIHRFRTHYRLPHEALAEQRRLDQLSKAALEHAFALATRGIALADGHELCIRKLHVPINLCLSAADGGLTRDWSVAMAQQFLRSARAGSSANVVLYHSRRQALIDLALSVARGDLSRVWAWRQLGLWRSKDLTNTQATVELARSLCVEPAAVVPTLRVLAEQGWLAPLARRLTEDQWQDLAAAALSEAGVQWPPTESLPVPSSRAMRDALRVLEASLLVQSLDSSFTISGDACLALAALAVLDVEPVQLRSAVAPAIVAVIADAVRTRSGKEDQALSRWSERSSAQVPREGVIESPAETAPDDEANAPLDLRQRGFTRCGGLLFILHVIEHLNLPDEISSHEYLGARPFVWVIHQLGLRLANLEPRDPAVLSFSGLAPQAIPPSQEQAPPSSDEAQALNQLVERTIIRLRTLLKLENQTDGELLEFVCNRRAEIVADPGWIDVKLSLDDVSTAIRRAGLDTDPGYVSWLGVVVRFVYE